MTEDIHTAAPASQAARAAQDTQGTQGAQPTKAAPASPDTSGGESTGDLIRQASEQISRLVRQEMDLARAELTEKGKRAGMGAGMFGGAAVVALYGIAAVLGAVILLLALALPAWVAALIVGVVLLAVAGLMALLGRGQVQQASPATPQRTMDSVKEDIGTVRERARR